MAVIADRNKENPTTTTAASTSTTQDFSAYLQGETLHHQKCVDFYVFPTLYSCKWSRQSFPVVALHNAYLHNAGIFSNLNLAQGQFDPAYLSMVTHACQVDPQFCGALLNALGTRLV